MFAGHHELALHVEVVEQVFHGLHPFLTRLEMREAEAQLDDVNHVRLVHLVKTRQKAEAVQQGAQRVG